MNVWRLLTSFEGRIRRLHYGLAKITVAAVFVLLFWVIPGVMSPHQSPPTVGPGATLTQAMAQQEHLGEAQGGRFALLIVVAVVACGWASLALDTKRAHDRDKGILWAAFGLIPLVGTIW